MIATHEEVSDRMEAIRDRVKARHGRLYAKHSAELQEFVREQMRDTFEENPVRAALSLITGLEFDTNLVDVEKAFMGEGLIAAALDILDAK